MRLALMILGAAVLVGGLLFVRMNRPRTSVAADRALNRGSVAMAVGAAMIVVGAVL